MKDFHIEEIEPGIVWCRFENSYEMCMAFIRVQEFYECKEFMGKFFTLEEYMDWYAYNEHEAGCDGMELGFDYLTRIYGCNVPSEDFHKFIKVFGLDGLRPREMALYSKIHELLGDRYKGEQWYLIGSYGPRGKEPDPTVIPHEVAHARYGLNPGYRAVVDRMLATYWCQPLADAVLERGYSEEVSRDECHAFALTGWPDWFPWYKRGPSAYRLRRKLKEATKQWQ